MSDKTSHVIARFMDETHVMSWWIKFCSEWDNTRDHWLDYCRAHGIERLSGDFAHFSSESDYLLFLLKFS